MDASITGNDLVNMLNLVMISIIGSANRRPSSGLIIVNLPNWLIKELDWNTQNWSTQVLFDLPI